MFEAERTLRRAYQAFNARDIEAALELMHPEVDWPNAWEGGRLVGHDAVSDYWKRQFAVISSVIRPLHFAQQPDGDLIVEVAQEVRDAQTGELLSATDVRHHFRFRDDLIARMDVLVSLT
jgi:ketosteroid isomerase-like protein